MLIIPAMLLVLGAATDIAASQPARAPSLTATSRQAPVNDARAPGWIESEGLAAAATLTTLEQQAWMTTAGRTRVPTENERADFLHITSPRQLAEYARSGVNFIVCPYGGYQPDAFEQAERARVKKLAADCREAGLHFGVILPIGAVDPDGWEEDPGAAEALTRSVSSTPFFNGTPRRNLTARRHPWEAARAAALLREAIVELRPDAVIFPDILMPANHEPAAETAFFDFLRRQRAGVALAVGDGRLDFDAIKPPRSMQDPVWLVDAWRRFRVDALTQIVAELADEARRLQPGILVGVKDQGLDRHIAELEGVAVDPASLWPHVDLAWAGIRISYTSGGRVIHPILGVKAAVDGGAFVVPEITQPIDALVALAFNRGVVGAFAFLHRGNVHRQPFIEGPVTEEVRKIVRFSRDHRVLFTDQRTAADVVYFRPQAARASARSADEVIARQAEAALISHRVPFVVADAASRLAPMLREGRILMLAGAARMSDQDIDVCIQHVRTGGGALLVGHCGVADEFGRQRSTTLLDALRAESASRPSVPGGAPPTQPAAAVDGSTSRPAAEFGRWTAGRGRILAMAQPGPPENLWLLRKPPSTTGAPGAAGSASDDAFATALDWLRGAPRPLRWNAPLTVAIELTASPTRDRWVLHRLNFADKTPVPAGNIEIRILPERRVASMARYVPDGGPVEPVKFRSKQGAVSIEAPVLEMYDAFLIRTEPVNSGS